MPSIVIPAKAGIQLPVQAAEKLDSGFRRNDGSSWQGGFFKHHPTMSRRTRD
jgi:hypothetical protein